MSRNKRKNTEKIISLIIFLILIGISTFFGKDIINENKEVNSNISSYANISEIPEYNGNIYVEINNNKPYFKEEEYVIESFEKYSKLDELGRCGVAYANISKETMPKEGEERESISSVTPTGWKQ